MVAALLLLSTGRVALPWTRTALTLSVARRTAARLPFPPFPRWIHRLWPLLSRSGSWNILMRLRSTVSLHLREGAGLLVEGSFTA